MSNNARYTVSFKGSRQDQPWLVVNADDHDDLSRAVADLSDELLQNLAEVQATYQAVMNASALVTGGAATTPPAAAAPSGGSTYGRQKQYATTGGSGGASGLQPGEVPAPCHHGERVHRQGNGARGPWEGYFCPSPKGTPDQCKPLFVNNR